MTEIEANDKLVVLTDKLEILEKVYDSLRLKREKREDNDLE